MNKRTIATVIRLGVFGGVAAGLLGLLSNQVNADGWGAWANAGELATCEQTPHSDSSASYPALNGYALANGRQLSAVPPCNKGTFNPASLAAGRTNAAGFPLVNNTNPLVTAQHGQATQTINTPITLTHSICNVSGFNIQ